MNLIYDYYLASSYLLSNKTRIKLLGAFKSSKAVYDADESELLKLDFLKPEAISFLLENKDMRKLKADISYMKDKEIGLVTIADEKYPSLLKNIYDPPFALFYKGNFPTNDDRSVAVVGARRCSAYGELMARDIGHALAKAGFCVVSGMAKGVDGYSHDGALVGKGRTYAVLGCGVDICYPGQNKLLYEGIQKNGAVISEYLPGTNPLPANFPRRNRIISGMSKAVIVIEAKEKSGSLITADMALEQGRDVYALPGRVTDDLSAGCNRLIEQGAGIIRSVESLIAELTEGEEINKIMSVGSNSNEIKLEKEEKKVYSCFDFYAKSIDSVQAETGMDLLLLLSVIMNLCKKGLIKETFKNEYIRLL
ncbi:MAG: DNA-processing protein DprA [Lachnospiraceae bacterium]|nr:DNA-processing protein DprA [Lachnospiraceae bacterium]